MALSVAAIIPTYGHFNVAIKAVSSFVEETNSDLVEATPVIVDDASSDWARHRDYCWPASTIFHRFETQGGLTRSWNKGLELARKLGFDYAITGNSDIIFSPGWFNPILEALLGGLVSLAGPLTNAPGHRKHQNVRRYLPDYKASDTPEDIAHTAEALIAKKKAEEDLPPWKGGLLNGFCMVARTRTWWTNSFNSTHVFNPGARYRMIRNEDELQGRWRKRGLITAIVPGSFVFHYRGVSRRGKQSNYGAVKPPVR